jgi:serine/threonine-protein kinase
VHQQLTQPSDATIDEPAAATPTRRPSNGSSSPMKVELVEGSGPHLGYETQCLLQRRLRAAAIVLAFGSGLYLVRRLFVDTPALELHITEFVVAVVCAVILSHRHCLSMRKLRAIELAIFGLTTVLIVVVEHGLVNQAWARTNPQLALPALKSGFLYFLCAITIYSMFIPNTWRRAAMVIAAMAVTPCVHMLVLLWQCPAIREATSRTAIVGEVTDNAFIMIVGGFCSVYGTHIVNRLRTEAFRARRFGQYRLKQLLGSGGMGEVYLAEHELLKRPCAIKLIRPDKAADPTALARFEREVQATAGLSHPNTIDIYDYGRTADGTFYYVMEYLPGLSLAELVDRHGPLPAERVIHLMRQTCRALREAHGVGLIHRDIKPENIFVCQRGGMHDVAKLLDFGLVKPRAGGLRQTGRLGDNHVSLDRSLAGSPLYMSPEQAMADGAPDARSDIYSLGAVAYFALTGRSPFEHDNPMKVLVAHARDPVTPPSEHRAGVPTDLEALVLRCLSKNPSDRFQDATRLEESLDQCSAASHWGEAEAARWWQSIDASEAPRHQDFDLASISSA